MRCIKYLLISVQGNHFTLHGGPDRTKTAPFPVEGEVDPENGIIRFKSTEKGVCPVAVPFDTDFKVGFECSHGYPSDFFAHSIPYAWQVEILIQQHAAETNMPLNSVKAIQYLHHFFKKLYAFYEKRACDRREAHKIVKGDDFVFNNCGCNLCEQRFNIICKDLLAEEEPGNEVTPSKSTDTASNNMIRYNEIRIHPITNTIVIATLHGLHAKDSWYLMVYDQTEREITILNQDTNGAFKYTRADTLCSFDKMPEQTISDLTYVLPESICTIVLNDLPEKMLSVVQKFIMEWYQYKYHRKLHTGNSHVTLTTYHTAY